MANLSSKIGEMIPDGLITDVVPAIEIRGMTIRKGSVETTYTRGTIMALSSGTGGDNKLVILGTAAGSSETLTPTCILTDDVTVGTSDDVDMTVYTAGCFDPNKITVKEDYVITADDKDALRKYNIVFKAAQN